MAQNTARKQLSRRQKAIMIVPLALLSGAWTLSLAGFGSATAAGTPPGHDMSKLPDGTEVPSQAIEAPASVPQAGVIAPGVPRGTADAVVGGASTSGIPSAALSAYQRAAQIINAADKEWAGKITGDSKTEAEGKADQVKGKVQNTIGGIKDTVRGE